MRDMNVKLLDAVNDLADLPDTGQDNRQVEESETVEEPITIKRRTKK